MTARPISMNPQPPQAASGTPTPAPVHRPDIFAKLDRFWHRLTEGLELAELGRQFGADARASYSFYNRDVQRRSAQGARKPGFWHTFREFAWAILEKLSPPRRVLLFLAFVMLIFPGFNFRNGTGARVDVDFHFVAGGLLLLLLMLEIADRVIMKRDLEIARDIQSWLLPATAPPVPGLAIAFATKPANTVAGDFYDIFPRPGGSGFLLAVADVVGKSIPAALLMATFQASLRTLSEISCPLGELVASMNRYACTNSGGGRRFTTAFFGEFDPASRALTYINAGHNNPVLLRATGSIERLASGGLPLGIQSDAAYETATVTLQPGDWLVIFTDGLVEAINASGEEFDEQRLLPILQSAGNATPEQLLRRVMSSLDLFVGNTPQHDDVTSMVIRVT